MTLKFNFQFLQEVFTEGGIIKIKFRRCMMIAEAYMQTIKRVYERDNCRIYKAGSFRCKVKRTEVDSKFYCLDMTTYTDYGHVLDRCCKLIEIEKEEEDEVKNFFVKSLMGIA